MIAMCKRAFTVLTFLIMLLAIIHPAVFIDRAQKPSDFNVEIASPTNSSTYCTNIVTIKLQTSTGLGSSTEDLAMAQILMNYSLDGIITGSIPYNVTRSGMGPPFAVQWDDGLTIIQVSQGKHVLTIIAGVNDTPLDTITISFAVNLGELPLVSNLSVENKTYATNDILLQYNVNEIASWLGYSLDNQNSITIAGNTTLTDLSSGSHSIVVYANDTVGNLGKSDPVFFTIDTSTPSPSPTPTLSSNPSFSPSPTLTVSPIVTTTKSPTQSPIQQPTLEPSPAPNNPQENSTSILIIAALVVAVIVVALLVYVRRIKKQK